MPCGDPPRWSRRSECRGGVDARCHRKARDRLRGRSAALADGEFALLRSSMLWRLRPQAARRDSSPSIHAGLRQRPRGKPAARRLAGTQGANAACRACRSVATGRRAPGKASGTVSDSRRRRERRTCNRRGRHGYGSCPPVGRWLPCCMLSSLSNGRGSAGHTGGQSLDRVWHCGSASRPFSSKSGGVKCGGKVAALVGNVLVDSHVAVCLAGLAWSLSAPSSA
jgi:hypothetical protein